MTFVEPRPSTRSLPTAKPAVATRAVVRDLASTPLVGTPGTGAAGPVLLPGLDYLADLIGRVRRARRRVRLTTLTLADGALTGALIDALVEAAHRGVDVCVQADTFTYRDSATTVLPRQVPTRSRRAAAALAARIREAGGTFTWLGTERGLLFKGRTHTKLTVVDDAVYAFGGVNLDDKGVTNVDFMLRFEDAAMADALADVHGGIRDVNVAPRPASFSLDHHHGEVLVDEGAKGDSIIYDRALEVVSEAEEVTLVSQYCPTGELGRAIKAREHRIYFNRPEHASPFNRILIASSMMTTGTQTSYTHSDYLHAKVIIARMPDGTRAAITGSHNFVWRGVEYGTREIALLTRHEPSIDAIETFVNAEVHARGAED
ncbi:phospholipase D-like domain-containing protein [Demequina pelophila]|uniref:phospholipase D-like domain-containing protein n=1 Tax=Demequina pelophila TaxID=1638984 RepID=UPI000780E882|nr:phospholipase D-like domain-containing protein [Demequina pelophila]